jgi:hypothetical protein
MQVIVSLEQNFDLLGEELLKEVQSEVAYSVALGGFIASHKQLHWCALWLHGRWWQLRSFGAVQKKCQKLWLWKALEQETG